MIWIDEDIKYEMYVSSDGDELITLKDLPEHEVRSLMRAFVRSGYQVLIEGGKDD